MSSFGGASVGGGGRPKGGGRVKNKWENDKRHYCSICNAWMGSDKQSIMLHENGKKHKENLQFQLSQKRQEKANKERQEKQLQDALKEINQAAEVKTRTAQDMMHYGRTTWEEQRAVAAGTGNNRSQPGHPQHEERIPTNAVSTAPRPESNSSYPAPSRPSTNREESSKIPKASNILTRRALGGGGTVSINLNAKEGNRKSGTANAVASSSENLLSKIPLYQEGQQLRSNIPQAEANETSSDTGSAIGNNNTTTGHYEVDGTTFLEGGLFAPLFEEDMTVQIWTGGTSSHEEMHQPEMRDSWKEGIVVKVRTSSRNQEKEDNNAAHNNDQPTISCDVAYLNQPDDEDETLEYRVDPKRLRIRLDPKDEMVPSSVEEAKTALESIRTKSSACGDTKIESTTSDVIEEEIIDENTGFTKFKTISVTRITKYEEERQKREQQRQKRREDEINKMKELKELQQRKQEEEKHASVDDSALGAYDVFSSNTSDRPSSNKKGSSYKGIDIHSSSTDKRDVSELVKPLAQGKQNVTFKKRSTNSSFKSGGKDKRRNVRRKTTDDDD